MDRGAWGATVHWVTKSWTLLSDFTFTLFLSELRKARVHWERQNRSTIPAQGWAEGSADAVGARGWGCLRSLPFLAV